MRQKFNPVASTSHPPCILFLNFVILPMSQPITGISHGCIKKEAIDKEGHHVCRGKRLMAPQEHQDDNCCTNVKSQEDEIASLLEECLTMFQLGLLQDIKTDDLVFCKPSKD